VFSQRHHAFSLGQWNLYSRLVHLHGGSPRRLNNLPTRGTVTIELRPGQPIYGASERNGVISSPYGAFRRSFVFESTKESEQKEAVPDDVTLILWNTPGTILVYEAGKTHKFKCPAKGKEGAVWGTDVYTADSSICPAACMPAKLILENGGNSDD